jgi:hypothetical protein
MWPWLVSASIGVIHFVQDNITALIIDLMLTALLAHPLYTYLRHVWHQKAEEICNSLDDSAKKTYLRIFKHIEVTKQDAATTFDVYYRKWYGRNRFVWPIVLVLLVAAAENFILAQTLIKLDASSKSIDVMAASIAGAYTFVTWSFFARVQRRNLLIADIMRGALRLAIAIPLGFTLGGLSEGGGPFLAFAVGVFPLDTISTILRQLANKKLSLELGPADARSQVSQLSGVDSSIADRIEDADITTIAQLAWCDPIELTMRANLRFAYVIDIVGQALSWVYLESKLEALRPFGLRGAYEIREFTDKDLNSADQTTRTRAEAVLAAAAAAAGMPIDGLRYAFNQVAYDSMTEFLYDCG